MTSINKSRHVLLITNDCIKKNMTGPAIRYWEFAKVLNNYFAVTLAIPPTVQADSAPDELEPGFPTILCKTTSHLQALTNNADVIITVGANLSVYPFLAKITKPLVIDMYIPFLLESLQRDERLPTSQQQMRLEGSRGAHTLQIRSADFIICASEKQKDFWLGWLTALGRVNPYIHRQDPTFSNLIDVVPFGLSRETPKHTKQVLKGQYKTIAIDDKVILWGGGIWNWLDPFTLIKAISSIADSHPNVKLFFMGVKSPYPLSATENMDAPVRAIKLSQDLGLYDKQVFFNDWTPYQERHNYLLEADIGASLHRDNIETRFSFRTRFLDYIWAGLPVLATEGDTMSDEIARWKLGKVVKSGDVQQVSQALIEMLAIPDLRQQYKPEFDQVRASYEWEKAMAPLIKFCESPCLAADKSQLKRIPLVQRGESAWWMLPEKILQTARNYGITGITEKIRDYAQWKLRK